MAESRSGKRGMIALRQSKRYFVAALCLLGGIAFFSNNSSSAATGPILLTSAKWAGYVLKGSSTYSLNYVDADEVVPELNCTPGRPSSIYEWAGLGGDGEVSLAQAGIAAECIGGRASYHAWDEWFDPKKGNPSKAQRSITIVPGFEINVRVQEVNASHYMVTMLEWNPKNGNQAGYFQGPLTDPNGLPLGNTAECVLERPELVRGSHESIGTFSPVKFPVCEASNTGNLVTSSTDVLTGVENGSSGTATGIVLPVDKYNLVLSGHVALQTSGPWTVTNSTSVGFTVSEVHATTKPVSGIPADVKWEFAAGNPSTVEFKNFLFTGDSTGKLENMHWSSWTTRSATGTGIDSINNCTPDCADGGWTNYRVRVLLKNPLRVQCGSFFTDAIFTFSSIDAAKLSLPDGTTSQQFHTEWTSAAQLCS